MKMKKKWVRMLALFAAILALPLTGQAAEEQAARVLDPDRKCLLTIEVGEGFQAAASFDLYKVAGLEATQGHDGYRYVPSQDSLPGADGVIARANDLLLLEGGATAENTMELASDTARLILGETAAQGFVETKDVPFAEGQARDVTFTDLDTGLYLVIARGSGLAAPAEYLSETIKTDDPEHPDRSYVATMAYSDTEVYTFQAMLVTLPGLTPNTDAATMGENPWTYPWVYNVNVILQDKYEKTDRYASLEIVKNLTDFKEGAAVTFLFSVEAVRDGASVYSNIIPVSFDAAGQGSALIEKIPAGADVVVTEVDSGPVYQQTGTAGASARPNTVGAAADVNAAAGTDSITIYGIPAGNIRIGDGDQETTVNAGSTVIVSFTNAYDGSGNGGGSVVNAFDKGEDGGWTLEQTYADANGIRRNIVNAGADAEN
nr:hypothetical protein [uncultured Acetatifactor sp.]